MRNHWLVGLLFLLVGCNTVKLPTIIYQAYPVEYLLQVANDSLYISINNQLKCPVRILLPDTILNQRLEQNGFAIIEPQGKKKYSVFLDGQTSYSRGIQWRLGEPVVKPNINQFTLPFANGKAYKIIQGYEGKYSHNGAISKYALDFDLRIGDTICSADEGFVVGLVNGYSKNGQSKEWTAFGNFITLYNPKNKVFTEYGHLIKNGNLVNIGDYVKAGEAIALSGNTGWSTMPHLHFVAFYRNQDWISEPIKVVFKGDIEAENLKRGDEVRRTE